MWASHSTLIYTSELILCSTICAHSGTRHNIRMYHLKKTILARNQNYSASTFSLLNNYWMRFFVMSRVIKVEEAKTESNNCFIVH